MAVLLVIIWTNIHRACSSHSFFNHLLFDVDAKGLGATGTHADSISIDLSVCNAV